MSKDLDSFVKICIKLDELRFKNTVDWGELGTNIHKNMELAPSKRIFLFWLCSIIDQFYSYRKIWIDGEEAMLTILKTNPKSFLEASKVMHNLKKDKKGNIITKISINERSFILVRDDYIRIKNSFDYFSSLNDDLSIRFVKILGNIISNYNGKNGILKLAYFLNGYLWENIRVNPPSQLELERFRRKPRKRLWMFIMFLRRDPSILKIFRDALIEAYGKIEGEKLFLIWTDKEKFDPNEIELPGDMWNIRLFKMMRIGKNAKEMARQLSQKYKVSPSIFDVTFEIGANKCKKRECKECPFGENQLCHKGRERYCPLADWLFLYTKEPRIDCDPKDCPIGKDLGKNLCEGEIDIKIKH